MESKTIFQNIDEYIARFPKDQQKLLAQIRSIIKKAAPDAEECISYNMPTFRHQGNLVHFAMAKNHLGFYPAPSGISNFEQALSEYTTSKGAIQFPLNKPLPVGIIRDIVNFRVNENEEKARMKTMRICSQGHEYYKSSDCPTCPACEAQRKPVTGFLSLLAAPARRALENSGITTFKKLAKYSEREILQLHGMGKASIPVLKKALKQEGLDFAKD